MSSAAARSVSAPATLTLTPPDVGELHGVGKRLSSIWRTRASSPSTRRGRCGLTDHAISRPFSCARGASSSTAPWTHVSSANGSSVSSSLPASILEKSENLVDERQQRARRLIDGARVGLLLRRLRRIEQQARHAEDAVHRRADLVAHGGEEAALGAIGGLRLITRLGQLRFERALLGNVAADALHLEAAAAGGSDELLLPFDPARARGGQRVLREALMANVVGDGERLGAAFLAHAR